MESISFVDQYMSFFRALGSKTCPPQIDDPEMIETVQNKSSSSSIEYEEAAVITEDCIKMQDGDRSCDEVSDGSTCEAGSSDLVEDLVDNLETMDLKSVNNEVDENQIQDTRSPHGLLYHIAYNCVYFCVCMCKRDKCFCNTVSPRCLKSIFIYQWLLLHNWCAFLYNHVIFKVFSSYFFHYTFVLCYILFHAEKMDELLTWCFMCALKTRVKKSDLPLLTSNFFSNYVQPCWYDIYIYIYNVAVLNLCEFSQESLFET